MAGDKVDSKAPAAGKRVRLRDVLNSDDDAGLAVRAGRARLARRRYWLTLPFLGTAGLRWRPFGFLPPAPSAEDVYPPLLDLQRKGDEHSRPGGAPDRVPDARPRRQRRLAEARKDRSATPRADIGTAYHQIGIRLSFEFRAWMYFLSEHAYFPRGAIGEPGTARRGGRRPDREMRLPPVHVAPASLASSPFPPILRHGAQRYVRSTSRYGSPKTGAPVDAAEARAEAAWRSGGGRARGSDAPRSVSVHPGRGARTVRGSRYTSSKAGGPVDAAQARTEAVEDSITRLIGLAEVAGWPGHAWRSRATGFGSKAAISAAAARISVSGNARSGAAPPPVFAHPAGGVRTVPGSALSGPVLRSYLAQMPIPLADLSDHPAQADGNPGRSEVGAGPSERGPHVRFGEARRSVGETHRPADRERAALIREVIDRLNVSTPSDPASSMAAEQPGHEIGSDLNELLVRLEEMARRSGADLSAVRAELRGVAETLGTQRLRSQAPSMRPIWFHRTV